MDQEDCRNADIKIQLIIMIIINLPHQNKNILFWVIVKRGIQTYVTNCPLKYPEHLLSPLQVQSVQCSGSYFQLAALPTLGH